MGGQIVGVVVNWCILATSLSLTKLVVSFWIVSASYDLSFSAICTINHYPDSRNSVLRYEEASALEVQKNEIHRLPRQLRKILFCEDLNLINFVQYKQIVYVCTGCPKKRGILV